MNSKFKKLAVAASVTAAMAAVSVPTHAKIMGAAGEALLVPLVVYATDDVSGYYANTIITVSIPGAIGFDDVPNVFVASNTTPTNADATLFPLDPNLTGHSATTAKSSQIHWYWFDPRSVHRLDKPLPVTANDVVTIDWAKATEGTGTRWDGVPGYMVIGTETARRGVAADFNMYGDAWLAMDVTERDGSEAVLASIPVLPMADGADTGVLSIADGVIYKGGIPNQVSPLISGMRTNRSDGIPDLTAFDLTLLSRTDPAMHVVWLDKNGVGSNVPVDVYDTDEVACSTTVDLPNELNILWIPEVTSSGAPIDPAEIFFAQSVEYLCVPTVSESALASPTFATYYLDEYVDTNADRPESAGLAFSLVWDVVGDNEFDDTDDDGDNDADYSYTSFGQTVLLGHERGMFRQ